VITVIIAAVTHAGLVSAAADAGEFLISFGKHAAKELNDESLSRSEQEQKDFLLAFQDFAVQRFLPMFTRQSDEHQGKGFEIVDIRPVDSGKGQVFVRTLVVREQGAPARLTWRIREKGGQFKIIDVSAEGVSMVLTLRQEYKSVIRRTGGVGGLVDLMREKLQSGAYAPKEKDDDL